MSTIRVNTIQHSAANSGNMILHANGNVSMGMANSTLFVGNTAISNAGISVGGSAVSPFGGMRNRIINGDMRIDQRSAGASFATGANAFNYSLDRWAMYAAQLSKFTVQQNAGSVTPPVGFTSYLGITSSSAYTVGASELFFISQHIEGLNVSDLAWGTANAKTVTLSFWVRSSLTGPFGGTLLNDGSTRSYPFTYTISSANTWEQKSITIPGDTTGTWLTTNGIGIRVGFSVGMGSNFSGTAGSWAGAQYWSSIGATSLVGINGATFYITGVQLEAGTIATPFERRLYGQELALCQRYLPMWFFPSSSTNIGITFPYSTTTGGTVPLINPVSTRVPATGITVSAASNFSVSDGDSGTSCSALSFSSASNNHIAINWNTATGRTAFRPHVFYTNATNAYIFGTGCEL